MAMLEPQTAKDFIIWGIDDLPYGPVELPVLGDWVKDERVLPETWVFARRSGTWQQASEIRELEEIFAQEALSQSSPQPVRVAPAGLKPGSLRRIKILAGLSDAQLGQLLQFMELQSLRQWSVVVKQGEPGDAVYLILEGELRARTMPDGKETILATFGPGDFFGEMSLFDHGPRSADVVANVDSNVLKFSAAAFNRLVVEAPDLAAPFLQATARTMAARIRADNKRLDRITQQFRASGG
jgi:CRP/FNR family transcriptional regulator, cyclic AMP receptor protein